MSAPSTQTVDAPASHAEHPPHLQHYFVSSEQQFDSAKLGMWLFLITEILLFSGMFVAYTVFRIWHPETFVAASATLDWQLGTINTIVLLASSFTVALGIHFAQKDERRKLVWSLALTILMAGIFMFIKYLEYSAKFEHGVFPGESFAPHGEHYAHLTDFPFARQFFSLYFVMTGIHGVHILVGIGVLGWVCYRASQGHFNSEWYTPVELTGLYWHLVDIIWIFLFPLLYLV